MIEKPRHDLIGWFDRNLHRSYEPGEAEQLFGSRIYDQRRPKHLVPIFDTMTPAERAEAFGGVTAGDHWIEDFKSWGRQKDGSPRKPTELPVMNSRFFGDT